MAWWVQHAEIMGKKGKVHNILSGNVESFQHTEAKQKVNKHIN